jgi:hypothetical protein
MRSFMICSPRQIFLGLSNNDSEMGELNCRAKAISSYDAISAFTDEN